MESQVGDEVAGKHAVQPVEQRVNAGLQVDQVDYRYMTCREPTANQNTGDFQEERIQEGRKEVRT